MTQKYTSSSATIGTEKSVQVQQAQNRDGRLSPTSSVGLIDPILTRKLLLHFLTNATNDQVIERAPN